MDRKGRNEPFVVLVVCTGNLCRSPMAAALFRRELPDDERWIVRSAGTRAIPDQQMDPATAAQLKANGLYDHTFRTTLLSPDLVNESDLILTADRTQRASVARMDPARTSRLFTLRQLAILMRGSRALLQGERHPGDALVRAGAESWSRLTLSSSPDFDIPDPYGRRTAVFKRTFKMVEEAVADVTDPLKLMIAGAGSRP